MTRSLALALFAVGLVVGLGGVYFLLHEPSATRLTAEAIYKIAKNQVRPLELPPNKPPEARIEMAQRDLNLRFPMSHSGGQPPAVRVPQVTAAGPAGDAWRAEVEARENDYEKQLQNEIDQIAKERTAPADLITSVVIPLIAAVAGLVTALAALIKAIRSPAAASTG